METQARSFSDHREPIVVCLVRTPAARYAGATYIRLISPAAASWVSAGIVRVPGLDLDPGRCEQRERRRVVGPDLSELHLRGPKLT
jgi:hypothetical protein